MNSHTVYELLLTLLLAPALLPTSLHVCFTKLAQSKLDKLQHEIQHLDLGFDYSDNCDYLEQEELKKVKINDSDLSVLQLNIRGLIGKQAHLSKFINSSNQKKIDVVTLSETWITPSSLNRVNVPGYDFVGKQKVNKKGGGVGLLINNNLKYKARPDLDITSPILENCSIELKTSNKNIIISSMYQPPNTNQREFIEKIGTFMNKIDTKCELILGMDHNMDFLKSDINCATHDFLNFLIDKEFYPLITKPTRITKSSATLIDNIIVS